MRQLIAGLALTPASVFTAVVRDSCSESLYIKQRSRGVLSLAVAEWPAGYRSILEHILYTTCAMKLLKSVYSVDR